MTDETHVTDPQGSPSLDDLADLHARTNRGMIALSRQVQDLWALVLVGLFLVLASLTRLGVLLRAVQGVS